METEEPSTSKGAEGEDGTDNVDMLAAMAMDIDSELNVPTNNPPPPNEIMNTETLEGILAGTDETDATDKDKTEQTADKSSDKSIATVCVDDFETSTNLEEGTDPIGCVDETSKDGTGDGDVLGETILSEDSDNKYTIVRCNDLAEKSCGLCGDLSLPSYVAQKNTELIFICAESCLDKFRTKYEGNFVEKMLRLRTFANKNDKNEEVFEVDNDDVSLGTNTTRRCSNCKQLLNVDNYISWEAQDYCSEGCLFIFQKSINRNCVKCKKTVPDEIVGKFCVRFGGTTSQFCSTFCLVQYKKAYKFCMYCQEDLREIRFEPKNFCSARCYETCYPEKAIAETNTCNVCHKKQRVVLKIRRSGGIEYICSERCFVAYKFVNHVELEKCETCITHFESSPDNPTVYMFGTKNVLCSSVCQKIFLITKRKIVVCGNCSVKKYDVDMIKVYAGSNCLSFSCSNSCLQVYLENLYKKQILQATEADLSKLKLISENFDFIVEENKLSEILKHNLREAIEPIQKITITRPLPVPKMRNVTTMCRPNVFTKSVTCKPKETVNGTQTDPISNTMYVPVPVPIFVPLPCHMYVDYVPFPTPIPLPLPVPIFVPTSRKSIAGVEKELLKIKNRVPADPLEAEILQMAEMAAGDRKEDSSSDSEPEDPVTVKAEEVMIPTSSQAEGSQASTSFAGEDVLSMALKMADDFDAPVEHENSESLLKKRLSGKAKSVHLSPQEATKPDSHLCLKYTFGMNAWKQWVTMKNSELQKTQRSPKLFKTDLLQLTADDLNYSLCLFVKEVRKPNGTEYAPDTIYYLCLGIQQYLYENSRIDNIFCDPFYEKFTDTFNEVCEKFANLYNESQYIVTRVEEEHLWESKQLGAHSPLVLLNTLMFFNTKHFSLTTVSEHLQLSFSHIMKHWKRNVTVPGARNVLLRFYPPYTSDAPRKKKVYEQQENEENPLRCPVKLYEFYLSKCPESVKTRNDVFYLQPERSCVPDSPVWYSTAALSKEPLEKMLNRVKMVKEINVALLTT